MGLWYKLINVGNNYIVVDPDQPSMYNTHIVCKDIERFLRVPRSEIIYISLGNIKNYTHILTLFQSEKYENREIKEWLHN